MLPTILQKCMPMAKDVARKSCIRMLWVTWRTINLLSHPPVMFTTVVLTLVKFHLQKSVSHAYFSLQGKKKVPVLYVFLHATCTYRFQFFILWRTAQTARRSPQTSAVRAEQSRLLLGALVRIYSSWMIQWPCFIVMQEHVSAAACLTDVFLIDFGQQQSRGGPQQAGYHWN